MHLSKSLKVFFVSALALSMMVVGVVINNSQVLAANVDFVAGSTATALNTSNLIHFNSAIHNTNAYIDDSTGDFHGFAWSEDIGWIDLNGVQVQSSGAVTGQASVPNTGGVIDFTNNNANVTVGPNNGTFAGHAWSSDIGWIEFDNVSTASFPLVQAPIAPTNLNASITTTSNLASILLSWTTPTNNGGADITDYEIEYCELADPITTTNPNPDCVNEGQPNQWNAYAHNPADINNLNPNNNANNETVHPSINVTLTSSTHGYKFQVKAINSEGSSPASNQVSSKLSFLTISTSANTINLNLTPTSDPNNPNNSDSSAHIITTNTNYPNGYTLSISSSDATAQSQQLIHTVTSSYTIDPLSTPLTTPIELTANSWGFRLPNDSDFTDGTNDLYLPVPINTSAYNLLQTNSANQPNTPDNTNLEYGVKVDLTKPSGTYQQTTVYTLISNS